MSSRFNHLADWLSWMETLHPSEIDLGLDRVSLVAITLGLEAFINPRNTAPHFPKVVTVAGTNGKGSCVALLEKFLITVDKAVGSYTSPHLLTYNERIKINGNPVSDKCLCDAFARIDIARGATSLTYFEFGTLAAFLLFQQYKVDYWLLEVGLGGRLDAVNILPPDIAVITSIAIDHESWLGNSREAIASEKAGILRPKIPFVCAEADVPKSLQKIAQELDVYGFHINQDFGCRVQHDGIEIYSVSHTQALKLSSVNLPLPSVAAAWQVISLLGLTLCPLEAAAVIEGFTLPGRFSPHHLSNGRLIFFDVAHNPAATVLLAEKLSGAEPEVKVAIVAMMADKDIRGALKNLLKNIQHWYVADLPDVPRAAQGERLAAVLMELGVSDRNITLCKTVAFGIDRAQQQFDGSPLLVFGSFFTVAEAMTTIRRGE
ncbi:bifunctional folylpolyglutamate synthase/dihydrofolate synthase [Teredinibacter haidensis]|uniref:bifunctional folylpolyglutamate synthase/dihydrofolate synthase n=1 Tax=Teredinibacter haidensis TaxID=2731755 RepID=UPI00094910AD|nr:folylpolyglutamate synthase/dihydrofolate synthase family protein [Teredinibacter haidensis]